MYKNLKAEMIRQGVTTEDIAKVLAVKEDTARRKINGQIGIQVKDCYAVAMLFTENNSIEYLFSVKAV